jgi:hypothetical protein
VLKIAVKGIREKSDQQLYRAALFLKVGAVIPLGLYLDQYLMLLLVKRFKH